MSSREEPEGVGQISMRPASLICWGSFQGAGKLCRKPKKNDRELSSEDEQQFSIVEVEMVSHCGEPVCRRKDYPEKKTAVGQFPPRYFDIIDTRMSTMDSECVKRAEMDKEEGCCTREGKMKDPWISQEGPGLLIIGG